MSQLKAKHLADENSRWQAVLRRDREADGAFCFAVKTTGVYCRPSCAARRPKRTNVRFFSTCQEAERAGFRPCKRCRPNGASIAEEQQEAVAKACRHIESAERTPRLGELAAAAGMSRFHFQRTFKMLTGVTPKEYATAHRTRRVQHDLSRGTKVTEAVYRAGFQSNGRFYANSTRQLGMTPTSYRAGGAGETLHYGVGECSLGFVLVAATERGICAILLGDNAKALTCDLRERFSNAKIVAGGAKFDRSVRQVVELVEQPSAGLGLPLDIRGTAFQLRVWKALCKIPPGTTTNYAQIARRIGRPTAARAVGGAIAANPLAIAIPCHRVVRADESTSGYRWGVERKAKLLARERTQQPPNAARGSVR